MLFKIEDKNCIQNKNTRKNKATNSRIIVNLKYKHVLQKKYLVKWGSGTLADYFHNLGLFSGYRGTFVEMALKYTYKPHKFYHRGLSIKIISYQSALTARIFLFISPRKYLIHIEFADYDKCNSKPRRQISMLMKFTKKIFFCSIEILLKVISLVCK